MKKKKKSINVHPKILFSEEEEKNGQLPFLDVLIIKSGNSASCKVYRKQTNKDDYIHRLIAHDTKTKIGTVTTVIEFFLTCIQGALTKKINTSLKRLPNWVTRRVSRLN